MFLAERDDSPAKWRGRAAIRVMVLCERIAGLASQVAVLADAAQACSRF